MTKYTVDQITVDGVPAAIVKKYVRGISIESGILNLGSLDLGIDVREVDLSDGVIVALHVKAIPGPDSD